MLRGQDPDDLNRRSILPILEVIHSPTCMYYTMEEFGTNLLEFSNSMHEDSRVHDKNTMTVSTAIREALQHVHSLGYAHRDVKSENILVRTASQKSTVITDVRLIDFGIACHLDDDVSRRELCGTPGFIAPETVLRQVEDARKVDVWSLGCVILERSVDEHWFAHWYEVNESLCLQKGGLTTQDLIPLHDAVARSLRLLSRGDASIHAFVEQTLVLDPKLRTSLATLTLEQRPPSRIRRHSTLTEHMNTTNFEKTKIMMSPSSICAFPVMKEKRQQRSNSTRKIAMAPLVLPIHAPGAPLPPLSARVPERGSYSTERRGT